MEKKTTRRIIGVLVVIALVIILLPLLNNASETQIPLQTAEVKAPPFPSPQNATNKAPTATTVAENTAMPMQAIIKKMIAPTNNPTAADTDGKPAPVAVVKPVPDVAIAPHAAPLNDASQAAGSAQPAVDSEANADVSDEPKVSTISNAAKTTPAATAVKIAAVKPIVKKAKTFTITHSDDVVLTSEDKTASDDDTSTQIKSAAWVVQMGSFRNKENAARLTDNLRAKGYKAFTFETKSNGQTRVYIGPEFKQVAAAGIANKLESDLKMRGVIVSYKPLELEG
jgi:DedD protein